MDTYRNKISQGSLIDYDNVVGTLSSMTFKDDSDIGIVLNGVSGDTATWVNTVASTKVIIIPVKANTNTTLLLDNATTKLEISGGNVTGTGMTNCYIVGKGGSTTIVNNDVIDFNRIQLIIAEFSAGITFATNVKYSITANCELGEVIMLDTIPSNYLKYSKWFINLLKTGRKGLKKSNLLEREIYRHKPTRDIDPSVVAHWSFKNGSLLDIAGSNHITGTNWIPTTIGGFFNNNGSGASLNLVTPVLGIQLCKIVKTTDYFLAINTTSAITVVGGTITLSGELTAGTVYVDGVASTTIPTTSKMYDIQLSFPAPVTADAFTLNKVGANYGNAEWIDLKFLSTAPTAQQVKDYHNQFVNLLTCQPTDVGVAVGNAPREWQKGTATTLTQQEITNSSNLPVGTKYVKVTTNQTCYLENDDMASLADNGYAKYWYYTAATNQFEYIEELISASTNLSYASGRLTFTAAADGDGFANNKRYPFVVQAGVIV